MKKTILIFLIAILSISYYGQEKQSLYLIIKETDTKYPLIGATVELIKDTNKIQIGKSDENGEIKFININFGFYKLKVSSIGYENKTFEIEINTAQDQQLTFFLEEKIKTLSEVEIKAIKPNSVKNEMAVVSAKRFDVVETDKYAGSRSDPARMVSKYAGVSGTDDSRNDIVVRGNSPFGVLWKVEGINIPNPNHFAIAGSSGGPQTMLNNKLLSNSDFYTSAFPAEFGNGTAAVFDLSLRNGNSNKYQFTGQFGFLGTEILAEGPFSKSKNNSSFLVSYRYSTLALFGNIGINIGTSAIPKYQDLSFVINKKINSNSAIKLWAISGTSNIDIILSDKKNDEIELFGQNDRDQYFGSKMGVVGLTYKNSLNHKTFLVSSLAYSAEQVNASHDYFKSHENGNNLILDTLYNILDYKFTTSKMQFNTNVTSKLDKKNIFKYGLDLELIGMNYIDSVYDDQINNKWFVRWNSKEKALLTQAFFQYKRKFNDNLTMNLGIHSQHFSLNNSSSLFEPRFGINYEEGKSNIALAIGIHSQLQPLYTYFYTGKYGNEGTLNKNINMTKSLHNVLSFTHIFANRLNFKSEIYYQYLYNIPIEVQKSSYSLINNGSAFSRVFPNKLENKGTAINYGLEISIDKYFSHNLFTMITSSVYNSKYKGSDGIERNSSYNGNFILNILFGKKIIFKKSNLTFGATMTLGGGKRYGEVDSINSALLRDVIYFDKNFNEFQFQNYFRIDTKITYKMNMKKVSHEIGLDFVNVTNQKNILNLTYAPTDNDPNRIVKNYQLGFFPIFYYRINF